jgi:hypothetical protein
LETQDDILWLLAAQNSGTAAKFVRDNTVERQMLIEARMEEFINKDA